MHALATDKKLGFFDDFHVTWLSFHPNNKLAQNPRKAHHYYKILFVFNLEVYKDAVLFLF